MTKKDVKEITYMPLVTFFSVLERPGKTVRELQQPPPLGENRVDPRLTEPFLNTSYQGRLLQPLYELNELKQNNAWGILIWYHGIAKVLLFPYISQKVQTLHVWRYSDVITADFAQTADLQWNMSQNWIFRQKSSKYRNFTRCFAYKRRKWHL